MHVLRLALAPLIGLAPLPVLANDLPQIAFLGMGFSEVGIEDLHGTKFYEARQSVPSGFLAASADFNGDGRLDEARILQNAERRIAYVVAVIVTNQIDTYVLKSFELGELPNVGIDVLNPPPGSNNGGGKPGLIIFDLDTNEGEAAFFDGEEFGEKIPLARRPTIPF